jgi:hypothetical protein
LRTFLKLNMGPAGGFSVDGTAVSRGYSGFMILVWLALLGFLLADDSLAGNISGRVRLRGDGRHPVLVFLRSPDMITPRRGGPQTHDVRMAEGGMRPPVLVARLMDRIRLSIADGAPHRIYMFSDSNTADLGSVTPGDVKDLPLDRFGPLEVYAAGGESGFILAVENPFHTEVEPGGRFLLDGVPPGAYDVCAWRPGSGVARVPVEVPFEGTVRVTLHLR